MYRRRASFHHVIASLSIRWRLALVSLGLLALLLAALGILISSTEENALLSSQASALSNEEHFAQVQFQRTKTQLTDAQILAFPPMSQDLASGFVSSAREILGHNVHVSVLTFDGNVLANDDFVGKSATELSSHAQAPSASVVTLPRSSVQQWLTAHPAPSYLLANNSSGQRELVILQPIAMWDKAIEPTGTREDLSGYRKALLQLSVPTTAIDQAVATTRLILTLGILAALGIAAALTLPLINVALRPLVEMERVSSRIAAGELSLRLTEPPAQDEIGRLAHAFNSMVARLEEAFGHQKRFVADVSHELRTPLTGLGGSLEMLMLGADNGDVETTHRLVSGMYNEVERLQRLVVDLLALARLDDRRLKLRIEPIEVSLLLNEVCNQVQGLIHDQEISIHIPPDLPALRGDVDHLRRVLLNIVENALKFTPSTGRVEFTASSNGTAYVTLEVRDTGPGIPSEALPYVFDRFYRADASRTRLFLQPGGNGLGLSIAKELVEAHGGTITIHSCIGEGTTVSIQLPLF